MASLKDGIKLELRTLELPNQDGVELFHRVYVESCGKRRVLESTCAGDGNLTGMRVLSVAMIECFIRFLPKRQWPMWVWLPFLGLRLNGWWILAKFRIKERFHPSEPMQLEDKD